MLRDGRRRVNPYPPRMGNGRLGVARGRDAYAESASPALLEVRMRTATSRWAEGGNAVMMSANGRLRGGSGRVGTVVTAVVVCSQLHVFYYKINAN
jgi:hypothetical protein